MLNQSMRDRKMRCGRGVVAVKMWDGVVWRGRYWTDWRLRRLCHISVVSTHRSAATANWRGHDSYTIRCGEWSVQPRHPRQVISIERLSHCYSHCYLYWYTSAAVTSLLVLASCMLGSIVEQVHLVSWLSVVKGDWTSVFCCVLLR